MTPDPDHSDLEKFSSLPKESGSGARKSEWNPGFPPVKEVAEAAAGVGENKDFGALSLLIAFRYVEETREKQADCLHLPVVVVPHP